MDYKESDLFEFFNNILFSSKDKTIGCEYLKQELSSLYPNTEINVWFDDDNPYTLNIEVNIEFLIIIYEQN